MSRVAPTLYERSANVPSVRIAAGKALAIATMIAIGFAASMPSTAAAQYFGRNKVQYETFHFRRLKTPHFDIYYYPAESLAAVDAARMAERWYDRHSKTLADAFERRSIILYADHADFEQTNVIGGFIDQSTGGVTEGLRSRVVLPFTGVYADDDHVIGHELTHVFQYDIASKMKGGGMIALDRLPLWLIEGMAEYMSLGRYDPNTAMWLRDAALRNDLPTIKKLSTDPRYFPYRYGEALWAYIGGRWGDDVVQQVYRASLQSGFELGIRRTLGMSTDTLSAQWLAAIREAYNPLMQGRQAPDSLGTRLLRPGSKYGDMDVSPAVSPDGKYVAFLTSRGLLNIDLYVADAETGHIVKQLTGPNSDQHFDAISFINSSGSWSPDGKEFAFIVFADGKNEVDVFNVDRKSIVRRIKPKEGVNAITDVSWGPNDKMVFAGMSGGISDLYLYDLKSGNQEQLTHDRYAQIQPTWSPDGKTVAFVTDSGPLTNLDTLKYGPMHLALMDMDTRKISLVPVFADAKSINPQYSPDGKSIYFVSDRGGFDDIYRVNLESNEVYEVTRSATGVSGIEALSPTMSVAKNEGRIVFSLFERGGYSLHRLNADQTMGTLLGPNVDTTSIAGAMPPLHPVEVGEITERVHDPVTGLPSAEQYATLPYNPKMSLEYLGSPSVGVGVGPYGTIAGGGVTAYFSDQLSNNIIGVQLGGAGDIQDFGGQVFYANLAHRWNWQVGLSHTVYPLVGAGVRDTTLTDGNGNSIPTTVFEQRLIRQFYDQVSAGTQYPFDLTKRLELGVSATHLSYGTQLFQVFIDPNTGVPFGETQRDVSSGLPTWNYVSLTAAFVGDYSYYGFTSPIAGGRYRFEVDPSFGSLSMENVLVDYRRYFFMRPVTLAFRAIHIGRYGADADNRELFPLYVGDPQLVRGYDVNSINSNECIASPTSSCPVFDRLIGSKMAVGNVELRIPFTGTDQLGLINFPYLATEISPFFDAGVAWTSANQPNVEFSTTSQGRVPVFSTGVSMRMNVLGYLVAEVWYAHPFQRPNAKNQWGFQLTPGW